MRKSRRPIVIASRRSRLARIQAQAVGRALARLHRHVEVTYRWIESEADRHQNLSLAQMGGKGLFVRAIEQAVLTEQADLAVHSLKDLPAQTPADAAGLTLAAIPPRADVRDCLIAADPAVTAIASLPPEARVGTSSPRRAAQLQRLRPDLRIEMIRGNVETRLAAVHAEQRFTATLLAAAGLERLGMDPQKTGKLIPLDDMLPAAGQGALAIQCRADDHVTLSRCLALNDTQASAAVHAERAIVASLNADCHWPVATLVRPHEGGWRIQARVLSVDGQKTIDIDRTATLKGLGKTIKEVIAELDARGARALLRATPPPTRL